MTRIIPLFVFMLCIQDNKGEFELRLFDNKSKSISAIVTARKSNPKPDQSLYLFESPKLTLFQELTGYQDKIVITGEMGSYDNQTVIIEGGVSIDSPSIKGKTDIIKWGNNSTLILGSAGEGANSELFLKDVYISAELITIVNGPQINVVLADKVQKFLTKHVSKTISGTANHLKSTFKIYKDTLSIETLEFSTNVEVNLNNKVFTCAYFYINYNENKGFIRGDRTVNFKGEGFTFTTGTVVFNKNKYVAMPPILLIPSSQDFKIFSERPAFISGNRVKMMDCVINDENRKIRLRDIKVLENGIVSSFGLIRVSFDRSFLIGDTCQIKDERLSIGEHVLLVTDVFSSTTPRVVVDKESMNMGFITYKSIFFYRGKDGKDRNINQR